MAQTKKRMAIILSLVMVLVGVAFSYYAYATTFQDLELNKLYVASTVGGEDMVWYSYTPKESGTYSFVSYSTGKSEAYLYTRTTNPDGSRTYNGLAYAPASDPNYLDEDVRYFNNPDDGKQYTHSATAFRLTCHLDAGTKYYFSAGWQHSGTANGTIRVVLKQDSVDEDEKYLERISVIGNAFLVKYNDGEWKVDAKGERYFKYNISKVTTNLTITLHYSDGTSTSETGVDVIDGYNILYSYNQDVNHWYLESEPDYTGNILTITVGNITCDYNIPIIVGSNYNAKGKVVDYITGDPIDGAVIYLGDKEMAVTGSDGTFNINHAYGIYYMTVEYDDAFTREFMINISQSSTVNNHLNEPIPIIVGDYIADGIINGKDCAYAKNTFTGEKKQKEVAKFAKQLCFTPDKYDELKLGFEVL